jgi:UDP-glucuronate 4-epimerase
MAMSGEKILVVGATGQVALPLANALAADNEVWGVARFSDPAARQSLEDHGVHCAVVDLVDPDLSAVPQDFTYVLNLAIAKTGDWTADLDASAGSVASVMEHCATAQAFLHCSSTAVYQASPDAVFREDDELGDNHRVWADFIPGMNTYSIGKIAAESVARYGARRFSLPTIITRLNVPYGDNGGWPAAHLEMLAGHTAVPIHPARPNRFNPIHDDDILGTIPGLLAGASVPATTVNWGGQPSSIEEWCGELGSMIGITPEFVETDQTISSVSVDITDMVALTGEPSTSLHDGLARMVAARRPDLLNPSA